MAAVRRQDPRRSHDSYCANTEADNNVEIELTQLGAFNYLPPSIPDPGNISTPEPAQRRHEGTDDSRDSPLANASSHLIRGSNWIRSFTSKGLQSYEINTTGFPLTALIRLIRIGLLVTIILLYLLGIYWVGYSDIVVVGILNGE